MLRAASTATSNWETEHYIHEVELISNDADRCIACEFEFEQSFNKQDIFPFIKVPRIICLEIISRYQRTEDTIFLSSSNLDLVLVVKIEREFPYR